MSYFKRFGDFCSGFAAFTGMVHLISRFISMKFEGESLTLIEKIKMFLGRETLPIFRLMAVMTLCFLLSAVLGRIFARLPYISALFCIPPVIVSICLYTMQVIEEYPMLYVVLSFVAFISAIADCVLADRADGKHRAAYVGSLVSLAFSAYCILLVRKYNELVLLSEDEEYVMWMLDSYILRSGTEISTRLFYALAAVYAILAVISFVLRDIYFIDSILAIPPAVWLIYAWGAKKLLLLPETVAVFAMLVLIARIIPAISGIAGKGKKLLLQKDIE